MYAFIVAGTFGFAVLLSSLNADVIVYTRYSNQVELACAINYNIL